MKSAKGSVRPPPAGLSAALRKRLRKARLVVCDVDGVLTDGGLYYTAAGEVTKRFDVHDGHGVAKLIQAGIVVVFLSGETSPAVDARARKLGVEDVRQGVADKVRELDAIARRHGVAPAEILYIGDDDVDIAPMKRCGVAAAVASAVPAVKRVADVVTARPGGRGAVRELADLLLAVRASR